MKHEGGGHFLLLLSGCPGHEPDLGIRTGVMQSCHRFVPGRFPLPCGPKRFAGVLKTVSECPMKNKIAFRKKTFFGTFEI